MSDVTTFVIGADFKNLVNRLVNKTNMNLDALRVDKVSWGDQFRNAMNVNDGDIEAATTLDYVLHFLSFGWKVSYLDLVSKY
jgi:solute carrier family 8 (sodium/calcium exchanger)